MKDDYFGVVLLGADGGAFGGRRVAEVVAYETRVGVFVNFDGRRCHLTLGARLLARRLLERPLRSRVMPLIIIINFS